jgi:lantibiotic leader peptide-processing serine protease
LTAGWHKGSFACMAKRAPYRDSRVTGGRPRLLAAALGTLLLALIGACSDIVPVAPIPGRAVYQPLPAAARYIVEMSSPGAVPAKLASAIEAAGGRILRTHQGAGILLVGGLSAKAATALQSQIGVRTVLPDMRMRWIHNETFTRWVPPAGAGAKTEGSRQPGVTPFGMVNPRTAQYFAQGYQWNMTQIRADSAWQITNQGQGTQVFILDSGVDTMHQDLRGLVNLSRSTSFAYAAADTFDTGAALPFGHDVVGHGTMVSSIIATNSIGIAAVAPLSQLTMVRVLDDSGVGFQSAVISGILYAADSGADVINMSIGGYLPRDSSKYLGLADFFQRVIDYAFERGTLIVAAAGNEAVDWNSALSPSGSYADSLEVPAGLHHVMSIGATGPVDGMNLDQIADYSNYGKAGVGVFAPGGNNYPNPPDLVIVACSSAIPASPYYPAPCPNNEYTYLVNAGTSFAAPHTSGEAAVVKAHSPGLISGQALETCLLNSAFKVNGVRPDSLYNFGRIDVTAAVLASSCQ